MNPWSTTTLSAVASEAATGPFGSAVSSRHFVNDGVPMLRGTNLSDDVGSRLDTGDLVFLPESIVEQFPRAIARTGDLVFTCWGTIGQIGLLDGSQAYERFLVSNKQMRLRPNPQVVDPTFLYYFLSQPWMVDLVRGQAIGSSVPGFNLGQLRSLPISYPTLPEQKAIAEVLGAVDDKIAANTALATTARELGVAMLRIDGPTTALGNVVIHHKRQANPAMLNHEVVEHFSLPAFDSGAGPETVAPATIKSNKFTIDTAAILVSKLNPKTPRVWPLNAGGSYPRLASTEFLVLEPFVTNPWVMWALLSEPSFSTALQGVVAGTSGSHQRVRPEEVLTTHVLDPRSIQPQLLADVGEVLAPIDVLQQENRTLAATRDALLPQLMSGKLRVRDAEAVASEAGA